MFFSVKEKTKLWTKKAYKGSWCLLVCTSSTGFVWWDSHKYAYLGGPERLNMTVWYEVNTNTSGTNRNFIFVVWPISVGLEKLEC